MTKQTIPIPEPLQRRLLEKSEALARTRRELEDLLELTQELLQVPDGYVLYDIEQGFVPAADDTPPIPPESQETHGEDD